MRLRVIVAIETPNGSDRLLGVALDEAMANPDGELIVETLRRDVARLYELIDDARVRVERQVAIISEGFGG